MCPRFAADKRKRLFLRRRRGYRHAVQTAPKAAASDACLDGVWEVERAGGLLPPLYGIRKAISAGRGRTTLGPLPGPSFDVDGLALRYRAPLVGLVDRLAPDGPDRFRGTATLFGCAIGRFRMIRIR